MPAIEDWIAGNPEEVVTQLGVSEADGQMGVAVHAPAVTVTVVVPVCCSGVVVTTDAIFRFVVVTAYDEIPKGHDISTVLLYACFRG